MIYFLYGPDTYRSRKKLNEIIAEFRRKSGGDLGVTRLDAEESPEAVLGAGRTASLFAAKELFVIENSSLLPPDLQKRIAERVESWKGSKDVTAIFWEAEVDEKKTSLLGEIKKAASKSQEFKTLSPAQIGAWISAAAAEKGVWLAVQEKSVLIRRFGPDLWAMANELDKIAAGWQISQEVREEEKIWNFTDAFLENRRSAFRALANLLEAGYETYYLVGALAGALRNLTVVWYGLKTGEIKKATANLNPYVARKNVKLARGLVSAKLKDFWTRIAEADLEIKTGRLPPPLPLFKLLFKRL